MSDTDQIPCHEHELHFHNQRGEAFSINVYDFAESHTVKLTEGELKTLGLLGDLEAPSNIIDVGANVGVYTIVASKLYPDAHILSAEPVPHTYELLCVNAQRNTLTKFSSMCAAIAADEDGVSLGVFPANPGAASFQHTGVAPKVVRVPTVRLETLMDACGIKVADFVKVDVEGMEYPIVWDVKDWTRIRAMSVELHGVVGWPKDVNRAVYDEITEFLRLVSLAFKTRFEIRWPNDVHPGAVHDMKAWRADLHAFRFGDA